MTPHSSLNIVPDILAVRIDISHWNSRMYELPKVRALQLFPSNKNFVLKIYLMQTIEETIASSSLRFPRLSLRCCGASKALSPVESACSSIPSLPEPGSL